MAAFCLPGKNGFNHIGTEFDSDMDQPSHDSPESI